MARLGGPVTQAVQVTCETWARDSHDLFDFEAHHLHTQTFAVPSSSVFVRNGTNMLMHGQREVPPQGDPLLRLVQRDGAFWVDRASASNNPKKLWLVVRGLAASGYRLAEGDVMKLGRFKFRVRQLVAPSCGGLQPELRLDDVGTVFANGGGENNPANTADLSCKTCRICLLEGPSEDDPLITPCQCRGSIEYVHLGCLRHWIRGRLNLSDAAPGGSYFYRPLACELCKSAYPTYIHNGKERQPLVEVPWTEPPFIVLENMVRDSQQHTVRGLHVISLAEKVLKLGRGHESDVRIADVSISRTHATIRFDRGHFVLEDNNSKFGTLVAMKKPRLLEPGVSISIQMGRTVLSLSAQAQDANTAAAAAVGGTGPAVVAPTAASTAAAAAMQQQLSSGGMGSSARGERALRLSLLTRGGARGESSSALGGALDGWLTGSPPLSQATAKDLQSEAP